MMRRNFDWASEQQLEGAADHYGGATTAGARQEREFGVHQLRPNTGLVISARLE